MKLQFMKATTQQYIINEMKEGVLRNLKSFMAGRSERIYRDTILRNLDTITELRNLEVNDGEFRNIYDILEEDMTPDRKETISGCEIEEYYCDGKMVVYVDNRTFEGTFEEAVKICEKGG